MRREALTSWASAALFAVLVAVSCRGALSYIPGHFDATSARLVLRFGLLPLALAVALSASCWGLGRRLGAEGPAAFALGLGVLAYAVFLLALGGLLRRGPLLVVSGAAALIGLPALPRRKLARPSFSGRPWWAPLAAAVLAFAAFCAAAQAVAPPTDWDVLAYHLALPKLYLGRGGMFEIPWMIHSHWPHLLETFYALPLSLGFDGAAALLHAVCAGAWVLAVFQAARRWLDDRTAWAAAAILAAQPVVLRLAGAAHSDGGAALFHFSACAALWSWKERGRERDLALAGVFSGLAACAKLSGIALPAGLAAWAAYRAAPGRKLRCAAVYGGVCLAVVLPWYLKTWAWAGDPWWPFFSGVFDARFNAAAVERAARAANEPSRALASALLYDGALWLALPALVLSAAAWLRRERWPEFLAFLWWPAPLFALAFWRQGELWRLSWPLWPALALTVAWWGTRWRGLGGVAASLACCGVLSASPNNPLFAALGLRPGEPVRDRRAHYLERSLDDYVFYRDAAAALSGRAAKVLLFREIRGYYLDVSYQWGDPVNQGLISYGGLADPEALRRRLSELGITHVLVNGGLDIYRPGANYYTPREAALMQETLRRYARSALREGALELFELASSPTAQMAADSARPGNIGSVRSANRIP